MSSHRFEKREARASRDGAKDSNTRNFARKSAGSAQDATLREDKENSAAGVGRGNARATSHRGRCARIQAFAAAGPWSQTSCGALAKTSS